MEREFKNAIVTMGGIKLGELKSIEWEHPDPPIRFPPTFSGCFEVTLPEGSLKMLDEIREVPHLFDVEVPNEIMPFIKQAFEEKFPGIDYEPMFDGDRIIGVSVSYNINPIQESSSNNVKP